MEVRFDHHGKSWIADLSDGVDISVPIDPHGGVRAWGLEPPQIAPHRQGEFVGSVNAGASVNFNDISFNPHAHGTHTECLGHITSEGESVLTLPPDPWMLATLVSISPEMMDQDSVVTLPRLMEKLVLPDTEAVVLRTIPNPDTKKHKDYSGSNPPYVQHDALAWLKDHGVDHLLLDLPSVDREEDGGALTAHKAFWGLPEAPRPHATITELIYVPDTLEDGIYLLNLQIASFENDACPSRPILFRLRIADRSMDNEA